jgi:hypothetical protein
LPEAIKVEDICVRRGIARFAGLAALFMVLAVCGCSSWWDPENDAVRRAVIGHELDEQGIAVDDLVVRLSPGEFRSDFGHGSRIVWLVSNALERPYREGEYFSQRDPERSYLFVQDVHYDGKHSQSMVRVELYGGSGEPTAKDLTLLRKGTMWEVSSEIPVE